MVTCCDSLYMGQVYKTLFLLAFFGFFRLLNLCPHSLNSYDYTRHLAGADVFGTIILWAEQPFVLCVQLKSCINYITPQRINPCFH